MRNGISANFHRRFITEIIAAIQSLAKDPRPPGCRKLTGSKKNWRIRISGHRVVYEFADQSREVRVNRVRHPREVYR